MRTKRNLWICMVAGCLLGLAPESQGADEVSATTGAAALQRDFVNPPQSARPRIWWYWLNGNITKEGITADLEAMKRVIEPGSFSVMVGSHAENLPLKGAFSVN